MRQFIFFRYAFKKRYVPARRRFNDCPKLSHRAVGVLRR